MFAEILSKGNRLGFRIGRIDVSDVTVNQELVVRTRAVLLAQFFCPICIYPSMSLPGLGPFEGGLTFPPFQPALFRSLWFFAFGRCGFRCWLFHTHAKFGG